ncbi:MAG: hypothetical protein COU46_01375 [Candidatus Niyogibacteria bacterium CG10_big_fil_rev_8_21_14_0_10_42_19]|uniref:Uncharacterized protein n=1 Tax=Candidatus Niyogibacteria bacterium CG10_big_fil_rev_8_21_14_0_10_42_19 TaxID=1974725 RepID=A0A2H0THJ3_9BACT|nr:MAG: hypothetical protein COU46_01375 [Candidatus Niyogibacteria bacterium CG10_big_fil_rev_8_21_14_0_10_42_19]
MRGVIFTSQAPRKSSQKLQVLTTFFQIYDFTRQVVRDRDCVPIFMGADNIDQNTRNFLEIGGF